MGNSPYHMPKSMDMPNLRYQTERAVEHEQSQLTTECNLWCSSLRTTFLNA